MRASTALAVALLAGVLLGPWACVTRGGRGEGEDVSVLVRNDLDPPTGISVYMLEASSGRRILLGGVSPGRTRRLVYRHAPLRGYFMLEARPLRGASIRSDAFPLFHGDHVIWAVRANLIRVTADRTDAESAKGP
jgi:hypothetical protein